jgi:hypothetical protein
VIVIDDADALLQGAFLVGSAADLEFLSELLLLVSAVMKLDGTTVVFVGLRVFILSREDIAGRKNPIAKAIGLVRIPPLTRAEVAAICRLGRQVDLEFDEAAVDAVFRWSSGNIFVTQMLCGKVLEMTARSSEQQMVAVSTQTIDAAAKELVAARETFERRLMPWLTRTEKRVLALVPRVTLKGPLDFAAVLPEVDHEEVGNALDALTSMNVLTRPGGRPSIDCKLLEGWVENHMELPNAASVLRREQRVRAAAAGVTASALLYAIGSLAFAAGEQTVEVRSGTCTTTAVLPKRAVAADGMTVRIARDCANQNAGAIEFRAEGTTFARFSGDGASPQDMYRIEAPAAAERVQAKVAVTDLIAGKDGYGLRLSVGDHSSSIQVARNWMGELPALARGVIVAAGALPAIVGLLAGFYKDVNALVRRMFYAGAVAPGKAEAE